MKSKQKKKKSPAKRVTQKNIGAYLSPFSGVALEYAPLHATNDCHIVLHECGYLPACKGWNFKAVFSPFWRLYYNFESGHTIRLADRELSLDPERLVLIPPHCIFDCQGASSAPHFWIHFSYKKSPHTIQKSLLELIPTLVELSLIKRLKALWEDGSPLPSENNLLLGLALIHAVLSREELVWMSSHPSSLEKAVKYMDLNFQTELKIRQIAEIAGLSESGLTRLFKKYLGESPQRYLIEARIREATTLLQRTEKSIDEIAEQTGFSNRYYFTRMFKKTTGQSPAEFRREHFQRFSAIDRSIQNISQHPILKSTKLKA